MLESRLNHVNHTSFYTHCEITGNHLRIYFTRNGFRHIFASIVSSSISFPWIQKRFFLFFRPPDTYFTWTENYFRSLFFVLVRSCSSFVIRTTFTENSKIGQSARVTRKIGKEIEHDDWRWCCLETNSPSNRNKSNSHQAHTLGVFVWAIVQSHIRRAARDYVWQLLFPHFYFYTFK